MYVLWITILKNHKVWKDAIKRPFMNHYLVLVTMSSVSGQNKIFTRGARNTQYQICVLDEMVICYGTFSKCKQPNSLPFFILGLLYIV